MSDDQILSPSHYTAHPSGIEPIEFTKHMSFCLGNVVKYVIRCDHKGNAIQDLKKARTYLDFEIEMREQAAAAEVGETVVTPGLSAWQQWMDEASDQIRTAWRDPAPQTQQDAYDAAYDAGWFDACSDHMKQRKDPMYPIGTGKRKGFA